MDKENEIEVYSNTAESLFQVASEKIIDTTSYFNSAETIQKIKTLAKQIEDKRRELTKPLNESLAKINAIFKKPLEYLKEAEKQIKNNIIEYENDEKALGKFHWEIKRPSFVQVREIRKVKIIDIEKIPEKYKIVSIDEKKVLADIDAGVEVEGIEITKEKSIAVKI